jgi:hypothetical protein
VRVARKGRKGAKMDHGEGIVAEANSLKPSRQELLISFLEERRKLGQKVFYRS